MEYYIMNNSNQPFKMSNDHSGFKSYASYENALKAFYKTFGNENLPGKFMIVQLNEYNSTNPKTFGRFAPLCIGVEWADIGAHFHCHVVA